MKTTTKPWSCCFAFLLLCFVSIPVVKAQQPDELSKEEVAAEIKALEKRIGFEGFFEMDNSIQCQEYARDIIVRRLRWELELDDQTTAQLRKSVAKEIMLVGAAYDLVDSYTLTATAEMEASIAKEFWKKSLKIIPEDKLAKLHATRKEIESQAAQSSRSSVGCIVSSLDEYLCLTKKQEDELTRLFLETWNPLANGSIDELAPFDFEYLEFPDSLIRIPAAQRLKEILREDQFQVYKKLPETEGYFDNDPESWKGETLKSRCYTFMDLQIAEYQKRFNLSEKQLKLFQFAKKGAFRGVERECMERLESEEAVDLDLINDSFFSQPLLALCKRQLPWKKTLKKILTEEQLKQLQQEQEKTARINRECFSYVLMDYLSGMAGVKLTARQHQRAANTIEKSFNSKHTRLIDIIVSEEDILFSNLDLDAFRESVGKENAKFFKEFIDEVEDFAGEKQDQFD